MSWILKQKIYGKENQVLRKLDNGNFVYFNNGKYMEGSLLDLPLMEEYIVRIENMRYGLELYDASFIR